MWEKAEVGEVRKEENQTLVRIFACLLPLLLHPVSFMFSPLPNFRTRVKDSHSPVLRDGLSLEIGQPSAEGAMLTPGLVVPAGVSHPNKNEPECPSLTGGAGGQPGAVFCGVSSLFILVFS